MRIFKRKLKFIARNFINDSIFYFLVNPTWNSACIVSRYSHSREVACFCHGRRDHETGARSMVHTRTRLRRRIAMEIQRVDRGKCHRYFCLWYPDHGMNLRDTSPEMCISLRPVFSRKSSFGENERVRVYDSSLEIQIVKHFFFSFSIMLNDQRCHSVYSINI